MTYREAIITSMSDEIRRDPDVFLIGEEVGQYNGAYKCSKGMLDEFGPERIIDTPITEMGIAGLGVGASFKGVRPIVEFMTFNFALQGIDHIINSCAKSHYMSNGDLKCPIVFRGINGISWNVGAQHTQCFASWYSSVPGLKVVTPYNAEDVLGLMRSAVRDNDPVLVLESEASYSFEFETKDECLDPNFLIPIGKAKIERAGSDVTIVANSRMVGEALKAADILKNEHDVSAEVINLRSIRPLDRPAIIESVKKTNRIVSVEEGWPQHGIGSEIAACLMESEAFDYLDAPLERITGAEVPMPYAANLEHLAVPWAADVVQAALKVLYKK
jgi:pyruvate dehydrogenase E1 component beta subunit